MSSAALQRFALVFGCFLGLCLWKFGNPVILEREISSPETLTEWWNYAWPPSWAGWLLVPFSVVGALVFRWFWGGWPVARWPGILALAWLGWQFLSATQTVDAALTKATLWQFSGCVACFFLGASIGFTSAVRNWLLAGILVAFTFCLLQAVNQRLYEFPQSRAALLAGEAAGWTNFPAETVFEMKRSRVIIETNGIDIANPMFLEKFRKGRVAGTLVYPNALAGVVLLLWPVALALGFIHTRKMRSVVRVALIGLVMFLGGAGLFWSGSKLGWLIALVVAGGLLLCLPWSRRLKWLLVAALLIGGLGIFAMRFQGYLSGGATSLAARFDYWEAAVQNAISEPWLGSGPGTFQRPYSKIKRPEAEMARLTHNDFLQQFSDSGWPGGIAYVIWIAIALSLAAKAAWRSGDWVNVFTCAGLVAWFMQGIGEFALYIPATAWIAFTLLGCLIGRDTIQFDKKTAAR